ncbi:MULTISPECIES: hypothetical protein [unclassified Paenibacillus]|uniref:hypothetical protein n=1 Tax=unclassified Paenibacillus TaxID=185978 RepID=UPI00020D7D70|nr:MULTISPECIES: hypothetical protein [unclassified Paenibacillus]EGL17880.1 hypothetical protein HMPREF9413_4278 [Paenibacillus sp. HGF7]EPD81557.1 hypothetical protein HMPREF1207_05315 [Paenibacillus sp. HGH0039]
MRRKWMRSSVSAILGGTLLFGSLAAFSPATTYAAADKTRYKSFFNAAEEGPIIPGLKSDKKWVPQGLALWTSKKWIIASQYSGNDTEASSISITDKTTGKRLKTFYLYESGGKKHTGHVGGLAVSGRYLWATSGKNAFRIPLTSLTGLPDYSKIVMKKYTLSHQASYATFSEGVLWIGTYTKGATCTTTGPQGTVYGYRLSANEDLASKADYTWKTPDRVQGMALTKDKVMYSQSCGRNNDSKLLIHKRGSGGAKISQLTMPPMSEGISFYGTDLYVNFESGSKIYDGRDRLYNFYYLDTIKFK